MTTYKQTAERARAIGVRHNPDGTTDACATEDRWMIHIDGETGLLTIDPDVVIEGDESYGYRLTAPFTTTDIRTVTSSEILLTRPNGERLRVDQHALLTHAIRTGERVLLLSDFLRTPPGQPSGANDGE